MVSSSSWGHLIAGAGGVLLVGCLFLPWAEDGGVSRSGWELWTMADLFFLIAGLCAIATTITGGRFGLFRPDLTLIGATDLLGLVAIVLLAWLLVFDFPAGADRGIGAFLGLIGAITIAGGVGDYRPLHGAAWFPESSLARGLLDGGCAHVGNRRGPTQPRQPQADRHGSRHPPPPGRRLELQALELSARADVNLHHLVAERTHQRPDGPAVLVSPPGLAIETPEVHGLAARMRDLPESQQRRVQVVLSPCTRPASMRNANRSRVGGWLSNQTARRRQCRPPAVRLW